MKELKSICEAYDKVDFNKQKVALATVVRVRGSSYRSPGSRMLITNDGRWTGSISGGCLEGDALRKARQVMDERKAMTITYDTSEDDNQPFAINLGCNGIIDVLFEPVVPDDEFNPVLFFKSLLGTQQTVAVAKVFTGAESLLGKTIVYREHAGFEGNLTLSTLNDQIEKDLLGLPESRRSRAESYLADGQEYEVFLELIQPNIHLMIFGGGFDARPLSEMGKNLGWSVTVTDECVAHIAPLFFPQADHLSLCQREFVDRDFDITSNTACVLMSHNYEYDRDVLKKILPSETPYIGILGPRKRFDKMIRDFENQGITLSDQDLQRIHAPIGLDIGAETPEEIAISIIGEVMGRFSQRKAGYLKHRLGPIHRRDAASDQVLKETLM